MNRFINSINTRRKNALYRSYYERILRNSWDTWRPAKIWHSMVSSLIKNNYYEKKLSFSKRIHP